MHEYNGKKTYGIFYFLFLMVAIWAPPLAIYQLTTYHIYTSPVWSITSRQGYMRTEGPALVYNLSSRESELCPELNKSQCKIYLQHNID